MKKLIEELNLTIKEFAKSFEIPYNTVRQWYNGTRKVPPYIKIMIEKLIELKKIQAKGKTFDYKSDEEFMQYEDDKGYLVKIIHKKTNTVIYSRVINYKEYMEFELNYWYVEYIKNKTGYIVKYYMLKEI